MNVTRMIKRKQETCLRSFLWFLSYSRTKRHSSSKHTKSKGNHNVWRKVISFAIVHAHSHMLKELLCNPLQFTGMTFLKSWLSTPFFKLLANLNMFLEKLLILCYLVWLTHEKGENVCAEKRSKLNKLLDKRKFEEEYR